MVRVLFANVIAINDDSVTNFHINFCLWCVTTSPQGASSFALDQFHFHPQKSHMMKTLCWTSMLGFVMTNLLLLGVEGFVSPLPAASRSAATVSITATTTTTSLFAEKSNDPQRRDLFGWFVRRATTLSAATAVLGRKPNPASAAEVPDPTGRVIELTLQNLEGQEGNSGSIKIQLDPEWAPRGVERFEVRSQFWCLRAISQLASLQDSFSALIHQKLTEIGFWKECRIFRVLPGFVVQFGINGNPSVQGQWRGANLSDDPVRQTNARGTVVFATAGPNSRTTQIFINTRDQGNAFLDGQGFAPIGKVIEGMDLVDKCFAGYGEGAPQGRGPNQGLIQLRGNSYLKENFPKLTYIEDAKIL